MDEDCRGFIAALIAQAPALESALRETLEYWEPDEPPVTILFAALGERMVDEFNSAGADANQRRFHLIESAMNSSNSDLVTAVATGLLEAIVSAASRQEGLLPRVSLMLGKLSRRHVNAWLAQ
ncbi:hypothetical protein [Pseudomonas sp. NPDC079086]|uniref:hypothetical protein n=1 Tax=unclassified Pseudomonas TaxID=196821 RepID=UPI0037CBB61E